MFRASIALLASLPALAQIQQLQESPAASVSQNLGLTRIEIHYHRPAVKGRAIWGELVPYGQPWRAGANDATTLAVSTDVKIAGQPVPKGTYALFVLPRKDRWTVILNKVAKQWGAYFHKPEADLLRFEVDPQAGPHQERLAYAIDVRELDTAVVSLAWEKVRIAFPVTADVEGLYQAHLKEELARAEGNPEKQAAGSVYLVAAKHHIQGGRFKEAEPLLAKATMLHETFWTCEWTARLLQKQGKLAEALPLLARAKQLATGKAPKEYVAGLDALSAEWTRSK